MSVAPIDGAAFFGLKPNNRVTGSTMDFESFLRLLTVQLETQNPLEPMSDRDFFAQMAQLGQVQGLENLQRSSEQQQAQSLIGKAVVAFRPMTESASGVNSLVSGVVRSVIQRDGETFLAIEEPNGGTVEVRPANIRSVVSNQELSNHAHLIGKIVSGSAEVTILGAKQVVAATGKVVGVSQEPGGVHLQVQTEKYGLVKVPLNSLQHIADPRLPPTPASGREVPSEVESLNAAVRRLLT